MSATDTTVTGESTASRATPYHYGELLRQARLMRQAARKANRPDGFEPKFAPGFVVRVWNGGASLEINYTVNNQVRTRGMAL
jgi:hypothetical protein